MAYNVTSSGLSLINEANSTLIVINPVITQIITAILILLLGFIAGKIVQKIILKLFEMSDFDRIFRKMTRLKIDISVIVAMIICYFIYLVAIVMALNRLSITTTVITTVVILLIIVLLLFIIFGLNDTFANMTSGLMIRFRNNIRPGEYIRIKDKNIEGYIVSVNMFNIQLETLKDETVFIPNMAVFKSEIIKPKKSLGKNLKMIRNRKSKK